MKTKFFLFFTSFLFFSFFLSAQNISPALDSVESVLKSLLSENDRSRFDAAADSLRQKYCGTEKAACLYIRFFENEMLYNEGRLDDVMIKAKTELDELESMEGMDYVKGSYYIMMANIAINTGDREVMKEYGLKAIELAERLENYQMLSSAYSAYSLYFYFGEDAAGAIEQMEQAVYYGEKYDIPTADLSILYQNMGIYHRGAGNFYEYRKYLTKAKPLIEDSYAEGHFERITLYNNLADAYKKEGDSETALIYFYKVMEAFETRDVPVDYRYLNSGTAAAYELTLLERYDEAADLYSKMKTYMTDEAVISPVIDNTYWTNKLFLLAKTGKELNPEGEETLNKIKASFSQIPPNRRYYCEAIMAEYYFNIGDKVNAEKYALSATAELLKESNISGAYGNYTLANIYKERGEYGKAVEAIHRILLSNVIGFDSEDVYSYPDTLVLAKTNEGVYNPIAEKAKYAYLLYQATGSSKAFSTALEGAALVQEYLQQNLKSRPYVTGSTRWATILSLVPALIEVRMEAYDKEGDTKHLEAAYQLSELSKTYELRSKLTEEQIKNLNVIPDSLFALRNNLRQEIARLKKEQFEQSENGQNPEKNLFAKTRELKELQVLIDANYPGFNLLSLSERDNSVKTVQAGLKPEELLISYLYTDTVYRVLALSSDKVQYFSFQSPGEVENFGLQDALNVFIDRTVSPEEYARKTSQVYDMLLAPILKEFPDKKHLIVSTDGDLSRIPMEALCNKVANIESFKSLPYLLNYYSLSYISSAGSILEHNKTTRSEEVFAGFAPVYQEAEPEFLAENLRAGKARLPFAEKEVSTISEIWNGDAFIGSSANLKSFRENAHKYAMLHLAMHADLEKDNPYFSRFLFSNNDDISEQLTVSELYQADLNTQLCVLSACNTGQGLNRLGNGMISLANAFSFAGVESVVYSLWAVPDRQTAGLMEDFYLQLKQKKDKDDALRSAKLNYLQSVKSEEAAHPFYWGGFVLAGNTDALRLRADTSFTYWLLGIGGLVALFVLYRVFAILR